MSPEGRDKLVCAAAKRYLRRCWWAAEDDLVQVGREACLRAERTFDPRVGLPEEGYVWRAIVLSMKAALWHESSPVSGGMNNPRRDRMGQRAPIESEEGAPLLTDHTPHLDALLAEKGWVEIARERIDVLTSDAACELGRLVLLDGSTPREVAEATGRARAEVYKSAQEVRCRLMGDRVLWALVHYKEREDTP